MKIQYHDCFDLPKDLVCAAYFKGGKWRIYDGSSYRIKNANSANELIDEVAGEKRVKRENIKLVRPMFINFKVVNF